MAPVAPRKARASAGAAHRTAAVVPAQVAGEGEQDRHDERAGGDALGPGVEADPPVPRGQVRNVVGEQRRRRRRWLAGMTCGDPLRARRSLGGPGEQPAVRAPGRQRVQGGLVSAQVVHGGAGLLLRPTHLNRLACHDLRDLRGRIVAVADQDRADRADGHAGRFKAHVETVRAHVALLRAVVIGVDEDGVVRAGGHARLAADADRLVEVNDPVIPAEHRPGRTGRHARRVSALVAAGHLERAPQEGEGANVRGLDVGSRHPDRNLVLALACRGTRVASDALGLVKHLQPAHRPTAVWHHSATLRARPARR